MKIYLSKTHADSEEDSYVEEGKHAMIFASKNDILKLCSFFEDVKNHITNHENCHMHFKDSFESWNKEKHFDIEVNLDQE